MLIVKFGGAPGVRDMGALESALMRPQLGYYEDVIDEAAALLESLAMNHPFVDGNKRVAFGITDIFLRENGLRLEINDRKTYDYFMRLFGSGQFQYEYLRVWVREHVKPT